AGSVGGVCATAIPAEKNRIEATWIVVRLGFIMRCFPSIKRQGTSPRRCSIPRAAYTSRLANRKPGQSRAVAAKRLARGCRRVARLDLAPFVPDGNELARVPDVVEGIRRQDEEISALALFHRPAIGNAQHCRASPRRGDQRVHRRK